MTDRYQRQKSNYYFLSKLCFCNEDRRCWDCQEAKLPNWVYLKYFMCNLLFEVSKVFKNLHRAWCSWVRKQLSLSLKTNEMNRSKLEYVSFPSSTEVCMCATEKKHPHFRSKCRRTKCSKLRMSKSLIKCGNCVQACQPAGNSTYRRMGSGRRRKLLVEGWKWLL